MGTKESHPRSLNYTYLPQILQQENHRQEQLQKTPVVRNGKLFAATDPSPPNAKEGRAINDTDSPLISILTRECSFTSVIDTPSDDMRRSDNSSDTCSPRNFTQDDEPPSPFCVNKTQFINKAQQEWIHICVKCSKCMAQLEQAIAQQSRQIKDQQLAKEISEACINQLKNFVETQEAAASHEHHDSTSHQDLHLFAFGNARRKVLELQIQKRTFKFHQFVVSRKKMVAKVSLIIREHIELTMSKIIAGQTFVRESSLVFKEQNYGHRKWNIDVPSNGLVTMMPFFAFQASLPEDDLARLPRCAEIESFCSNIMHQMRLSNEVCLLALIFIERLGKLSNVQLLTINWRPILYTALLLAAKYWQDIYFWNVDFVDCTKVFELRATNQLESTFLTLCNYELFVSEDLYEKYYSVVL